MWRPPWSLRCSSLAAYLDLDVTSSATKREWFTTMSAVGLITSRRCHQVIIVMPIAVNFYLKIGFNRITFFPDQASSSCFTSWPRTLNLAWCINWYFDLLTTVTNLNPTKVIIKFLEPYCSEIPLMSVLFRFRAWQKLEAAHPLTGVQSWTCQWCWSSLQLLSSSSLVNYPFQQSVGLDARPPTYRQDFILLLFISLVGLRDSIV